MNGDTYGSSVLAALGVVNVFADDADALPGDDARRGGRPRGPTSCWRRPSPTRSPSATSPSSATVAPDVRLVDGQDLFWWGVRTPAAAGAARSGRSAP